jgi:hypothetical protein
MRVNCEEARIKACHHGHRDIVARLCALIANAERSDLDRVFNEEILTAARGGQLDVVSFFLDELGLDPSANDHEAFFTACRSNNLLVLNRLLAHPKIHLPSLRERAFVAALRSPAAIMDRLLEGVSVDEFNEVILYALRNTTWRCKCDAILSFALRDPRPFDAAADDSLALRLAATHIDDARILRRLLEDPRVDPSAKANEAIASAAKNGRLAAVDVLLADARVDPSARDCAAFFDAVKGGYLAIVDRLLADPRVDIAAHARRALVTA